LHNLLDGGRVIPPMDIEEINVVCPELEEGSFNRVLE
jgi:hypothetical protein